MSCFGEDALVNLIVEKGRLGYKFKDAVLLAILATPELATVILKAFELWEESYESKTSSNKGS